MSESNDVKGSQQTDQKTSSHSEIPDVYAGIERGIGRLERDRARKAQDRAEGNLRGQRYRGEAEKLITRALSGAIYALVVVACLFAGKLATTIVVAAMAWLCCSEFFRISRMAGRMPNEIIGLTAAIAYPISAYLHDTYNLLYVTYAFIIACACWYVMTPRASIGDVATTVFGPLYTSMLFSSLVSIRCSDPGFSGGLLAFGVIGSVWLNDAAAYLVGSRIGKHKLAPHISPNKSIEGFWGGLVGCVLIWVILAILNVRGLTIGPAVVCGILVGIASVIGDLFESRIKRGVGIKDSGNIIPGHGGMLDRSDSLLFAGVVSFVLLKAFSII